MAGIRTAVARLQSSGGSSVLERVFERERAYGPAQRGVSALTHKVCGVLSERASVRSVEALSGVVAGMAATPFADKRTISLETCFRI